MFGKLRVYWHAMGTNVVQKAGWYYTTRLMETGGGCVSGMSGGCCSYGRYIAYCGSLLSSSGFCLLGWRNAFENSGAR